jgi:hypothetical protein
MAYLGTSFWNPSKNQIQLLDVFSKWPPKELQNLFRKGQKIYGRPN